MTPPSPLVRIAALSLVLLGAACWVGGLLYLDEIRAWAMRTWPPGAAGQGSLPGEADHANLWQGLLLPTLGIVVCFAGLFWIARLRRRARRPAPADGATA